jgi:two-component system OmpR family response regulator
VDDERNIAQLVAMALRYEGFVTETAADGRSALAAVRAFGPHLVVLDVMLPDVDGFEVGRRLRAAGEPVPVLFLTARDGVEDRVRGLTLGGDDYLTKPFAIEELVARVRAILRRAGSREQSETRLRFADLELDEETREVRRGGRLVKLSPTEFSLLRYLMLNARRIQSKAQILDHVWQYDFGGDGGIVETYIGYLRRKVDVGAPPLIHTVRGVGYTLRLPEE